MTPYQAMTLIQKIKHKIAVREAAKRRQIARIAQAVTDGWNAAQMSRPRYVRLRFDGMTSTYGLN